MANHAILTFFSGLGLGVVRVRVGLGLGWGLVFIYIFIWLSVDFFRIAEFWFSDFRAGFSILGWQLYGVCNGLSDMLQVLRSELWICVENEFFGIYFGIILLSNLLKLFSNKSRVITERYGRKVKAERYGRSEVVKLDLWLCNFM